MTLSTASGNTSVATLAALSEHTYRTGMSAPPTGWRTIQYPGLSSTQIHAEVWQSEGEPNSYIDAQCQGRSRIRFRFDVLAVCPPSFTLDIERALPFEVIAPLKGCRHGR